MEQLAIRARSDSIDEAKRALEKLVPGDLGGLAVGRQRYTQLTNEVGGIRDDLMVANLDNHLLLVVNASRKRDDEDYLVERLARVCVVECLSDRALIALQGPLAERGCLLSYPNIESLRLLFCVGTNSPPQMATISECRSAWSQVPDLNLPFDTSLS